MLAAGYSEDQLPELISKILRNRLEEVETSEGSAEEQHCYQTKLQKAIEQEDFSISKVTGDWEEFAPEPIDMQVNERIQTTSHLLESCQNLNIHRVPRSHSDEQFTQHKKNQQTRIIKRRLQLEKTEPPRIDVPENWRLTNLRYNLTKKDLKTLLPNNDLNDSIVNLFLTLLSEQLIDSETKERSHFFNTYFMSYLIGSELNNEYYIMRTLKTIPSKFQNKIIQNYASVKKWAKIDIFQKEYIIIPINMPHHWSLIIVVRLNGLIDSTKGKPSILYMDSIGQKSKTIIEAVRIYLRQELKEKGNYQGNNILINQDTLPDYQLLLPRQTNLHDCGLYILTYVQRLLISRRQRQQDFSILQNRFKLDLFPRSLIFTMRSQLVRMFVALSNGSSVELECREYINNRNKQILQALPVDYDEINEKQFKKYLAIYRIHPYNEHEYESYRIAFYLSNQTNFFEKDTK